MEAIYLMSNVVTTYAVFLFFKIFFEERKTHKNIEIISYTAMYLITSYLFIMDYPPKIIITINIILLILISANYKSSKLQKIISALLIYIVFWAIEMIVVLLTSNIELSIHQSTSYSSIVGNIIIPIICILLANIFKNLKNLKKGENIPLIYWGISITIPLSSIYIGNIVFRSSILTRKEMIICTLWIFAINIGIIIIYDILKKLMEATIQNMHKSEMIKYYKKETYLINKSNENIKKLKHDLKNHLTSIKILSDKQKYTELENYINNLQSKITIETKSSNTENIIIDGIINCKIQEANSKNIKTEVDMAIPTNLKYNETEMTIILGNLLDNAIEATNQAAFIKKIDIIGEYKKENLIISIKNHYLGGIDKENLTTTKKDKENHGLGLISAREAANKINGNIYINIENGQFIAQVILPI